MGKHSATPSGGRSMVVGIVVGAAVLVGSGVAAVAMISGDDPAGARTPTSSTTSSGSRTTASGGETTPTVGVKPTVTATVTATAETGSDAARGALAACRVEVAEGDRLASAAAASARDWGTHAGAQWKLDAGTISYAEAEALWASSKMPAAADVAAFAAADQAYTKTIGACSAATLGTAGTDVAAQGVACSARGAAIAVVARTGRVVNTQWAAHVEQMKGKATNAGHGYHMEWIRRTTEAKPALEAYRSAAAALAEAPACPTG